MDKKIKYNSINLYSEINLNWIPK